MPTVAYSGTDGTVLIGAVNADVEGYSFDADVDTVKTTTTADAGWQSVIPTIKKVEGSFDFFYNKSKKPYASGGLNLAPGAKPTLSFTLATGDVATGVGLIKKTSIKSKTTDAIRGTCSFESDGAWTFPT